MKKKNWKEGDPKGKGDLIPVSFPPRHMEICVGHRQFTIANPERGLVSGADHMVIH